MEALWRRVAAYVVCRDQDGRILLTRFVQNGNPDSGCWTMPGGGMEWGEQPVDTATRELAEETGLRARVGPVLAAFSRWLEPHEAANGEPGHVLGLIYSSKQKDIAVLQFTIVPRSPWPALGVFPAAVLPLPA